MTSTPDQRLFRWQTQTMVMLFIGYAGYYVCRSNLAVCTPEIIKEYEGRITLEHIGLIQSIGIALYAIGKINNGLMSDLLGGRMMFLLGMAASVVCTVAFGLASGTIAFATIWALNRFVQSMGWVALVKTASRWFPFSRHGMVMAVLSLSFLVGDWLVRRYLGAIMLQGVEWRGIFFVSAVTLAVIALACTFLLKSSPADIGIKEPHVNPANVYGATAGASKKTARPAIRELLRPLLVSPAFWLVCVMNFGLTFIRSTFNMWTPMYFVDQIGVSSGRAAILSSWFPLAGAGSALLAGWASDFVPRKRGRVIVPCVLMLTLALLLLSLVPVGDRAWLATLLLVNVSIFLIAPYSFLSGVIALDLGGKQGSATVAGLVDSAGYCGAILSGWGIGRIAARWGWSAAFLVLAGCAALTFVAALIHWLMQERMVETGDRKAGPQE